MSSIYLCVNYNAGNAGPGWPSGSPRRVRIPFVEIDNALATFALVCRGESRAASALPLGVIPDSAWVEENVPSPYPMPAKIHRYFRREADGVGGAW